MLTRFVKVGPYKLIEPLGKGGMAQVWRAQWLGEDGMVKPCAFKVMRQEVARDETFRAMFLDEARLSMRLSHSNICRVYSAASEPCLYIVMEWVNGRNLAELMERLRLVRQPLPYELITYIIYSLLLALGSAHQLRVNRRPFPIIHRDVSPQNVMISVHGEVKLMDFGIARVLADETTPADYAGKLRYVPKEQLFGKISPATDLYATGAILHELIEGTLFRADCRNKDDMLEAIYHGPVPVLTRPSVPERLRKLHQVLLQPAAKDRVQSTRDGLAILGRVVAEQTNLGQIVSTFLGPQATVSGSTLGDFEVPEEIAQADLGEYDSGFPSTERLPDLVEPAELPGSAELPRPAGAPGSVDSPRSVETLRSAEPPGSAEPPRLAGQPGPVEPPRLAGQPGPVEPPCLAGQSRTAEPPHLVWQPGPAEPPGPANPPRAAESPKDGEVMVRIPTVVVTKPGMPPRPRFEETSRSIPRARLWSPAGLVDAAERGPFGSPAASESTPTALGATKPSSDAGPNHAAIPLGPAQELEDEEATEIRRPEDETEDLTVTEVFVPSKLRRNGGSTTQQVAAPEQSEATVRWPSWMLAASVGTVGALGIAAAIVANTMLLLDGERAARLVDESQMIEVELMLDEGEWLRVSPGEEVRVPSSEHRVRWRAHDTDAWINAGVRRFDAGRCYVFASEEDELLVRDTHRQPGNNR